MTDLKAAFDAWVREYDGSTEMADGQYIDDEVHACWVAYQAAHAAAIEAVLRWVEEKEDGKAVGLWSPGLRRHLRALAEKEVSDGALS